MLPFHLHYRAFCVYAPYMPQDYTRDRRDMREKTDLISRVRAGFIMRGTSLHSWCREHGVYPSNANACLTGRWRGKRGVALKASICRAAGVELDAKAA
jgi:hypothetical protein